MVRKVMQLEMREKKQNGKQLSEAIADFEMIKSIGTINSSTTVTGLKQLISIAGRGFLSRVRLGEEGMSFFLHLLINVCILWCAILCVGIVDLKVHTYMQ